MLLLLLMLPCGCERSFAFPCLWQRGRWRTSRPCDVVSFFTDTCLFTSASPWLPWLIRFVFHSETKVSHGAWPPNAGTCLLIVTTVNLSTASSDLVLEVTAHVPALLAVKQDKPYFSLSWGLNFLFNYVLLVRKSHAQQTGHWGFGFLASYRDSACLVLILEEQFCATAHTGAWINKLSAL